MVELIPMDEEGYQAFMERAIPEYAEEKVRAGNVHADQALDSATKQFQALLPDGLSTPDHFFYAIREEEQSVEVGTLWYGVREDGGQRYAALYDFWIHPEYRRQGYGTHALHLLESRVVALGLDEIRLHVFGHNHAARALYESVGYETTNVNMAKKVA